MKKSKRLPKLSINKQANIFPKKDKNMNCRFSIGLCVLLCVGTFKVMAQDKKNEKDTTFQSKTINIYPEYTPEVKVPKKPELKPSELKLSTPTETQFQYNVPPQVLHYSYGKVNIKPLALGIAEEKKYSQNYASLGFGNLSTIYADLGLTHHQTGKYDAYLHANHFSQKKGSIADRQSSHTDIILGGKYFLNNYTINGNIEYERTGFTYYGYDHKSYSFSKDELLQAYNTLSLQANLDKFSVHQEGIDFQPEIKLYLLGIKTGGSEMGMGWNAPLSYNLQQNLEVGLGVSGLLSGFQAAEGKDRSNSHFQINPQLQYKTEKMYVKAGVSPAWASRNGFALLPNIQFKYILGTPARAAVSAGWDGEITTYSYLNLAAKNPFIYLPWVDNGVHRKIFAGFELALISNVKVEGRVAYHNFNNMATFVNNYARNVAGNTFDVLYLDKVNAFEIYAGSHILLANKFDLGANVRYMTYQSDAGTVYHEPNLDLQAFMKVRPISWLLVGADLQLLNGIKYKDYAGIDKKLNPLFNLGLNAQVDFYERYSVFLNLSNISSGQYQRWNQYQVYGFNIFGGLKVKF